MLEANKITFNQNLIAIGAACGEAVGILDSRFLRNAHQRRQRIAEAAGSAAIDGRPTTPERLFAWLGDVPLEGQRNLGAEGYAAQLFGVLNGHDSPLLDEARALAERAGAQAGRDPIAAAALLFRGRGAITAASRAGYFFYLQKTLGVAEPATSRFFSGLEAAAKRPPLTFEMFVSDRLAKAARLSLANARGLRDGVVAMSVALNKARRSSHVREIAELLFAGHPLTFGSAARVFKLSRLSARKHLLALEKLGLAQVATRRKKGRVYIARDGLLTFQAPAPSPLRSRELFVGSARPLTAAEKERLELVADDVVLQMNELDRALKRLAPRFSD